jgi:hypothetical protein
VEVAVAAEALWQQVYKAVADKGSAVIVLTAVLGIVIAVALLWSFVSCTKTCAERTFRVAAEIFRVSAHAVIGFVVWTLLRHYRFDQLLLDFFAVH